MEMLTKAELEMMSPVGMERLWQAAVFYEHLARQLKDAVSILILARDAKMSEPARRPVMVTAIERVRELLAKFPKEA